MLRQNIEEGKIRSYWNEVTEKIFFFYFQPSVFLIFVKKYEPPSLLFNFDWEIYDVNNEHMFWELLETCY